MPVEPLGRRARAHRPRWRGRDRIAALAAGAAVVAATVGLGACSAPGEPVPTGGGDALCAVFADAHAAARARGSGFAEVVHQLPPDDGGVLLEVGDRYPRWRGRLGRFEALAQELARRSATPTVDGAPIGEPTADVARDAQALDRLLDAGRC